MWNIEINIDGEILELRIGTTELMKIKKAGINIRNEDDMQDIENIYTIFIIAVKNKTFKDVYEASAYIDNSSITFELLANKITDAMELGIRKVSKEKKIKQ